MPPKSKPKTDLAGVAKELLTWMRKERITVGHIDVTDTSISIGGIVDNRALSARVEDGKAATAEERKGIYAEMAGSMLGAISGEEQRVGGVAVNEPTEEDDDD